MAAVLEFDSAQDAREQMQAVISAINSPPEGKWSRADDDVLALAQELIDAHHERLKRANILILMREDSPKRNGKLVHGQAGTVSDKNNAEIGAGIRYHFKIWLSEEYWLDASDDEQRRLLDHELCHCQLIDGKPKIRAHDVEEFSEIVHRYGLKEDQRTFGKVVQQQELPFEEPEGRVDTIPFDR